MYIPDQPLAAWKISVTTLHLLAISMTAMRIWFRYSRRRIWVDDLAVIPAAFADIFNVATIWLMYVETENAVNFHNYAVLYWLTSIPWYTIIWCTRITLVLSITRIFPVWGTLRRLARGMAISFGVVYLGFMTWLLASNCKNIDPNIPPLEINFLHCNPERNSLTIIGISVDMAACIFLFLSPIAILWFCDMHRGQQVLVLTLLASTALVLLSVALLCAFSYSPRITGPGRPLVIGMMYQFESAISILCCNLTVAVVYFHRDNGGNAGSVDDDIQWKKSPQRPRITTAVPLTNVRSVDNLADNDGSPRNTSANESHSSASVVLE